MEQCLGGLTHLCRALAPLDQELEGIHDTGFQGCAISDSLSVTRPLIYSRDLPSRPASSLRVLVQEPPHLSEALGICRPR